MRLNFKNYFKDIHKGGEIWIIGGGASMNYVSPSFFDGKLTMGLGEAFRKYKNCTYYLRKDGRSYQGHDIFDVIKYNPSTKLIFSDYVGCAVEWGKNEFDVDVDYYFFEHEPSHGELSGNWNKIEGKFANGIGLTGIGVHLAAYMGVKNILICGNDTVW